jgi:hypothetical protein
MARLVAVFLFPSSSAMRYNLRLTELMLFTYANYNFPMNKIVYVSSMILYDSWPIRVLNVLLIRRLLDVRTHWVIL